MPELPDVSVYVERSKALLAGLPLERVRLASPFLLRSVSPPIREAEGKPVTDVFRMGKRIVFELDRDHFLVIHLMISGRLRWRERGVTIPKKVGLAAFDFPSGSLLFTEASTKKRASLHFVAGRAGLTAFERGGIEPLEASLEQFAEALTRENRTLKRALTDPRLMSGIGNAYSDEILFAARLSPVKRSQQLQPDEIGRLYRATRETLVVWTERLREEVGEGFPEQVTAFREGMAVHGRYKEPCPACGTLVQRIRHADNEVNYCPRCQTDGKLLADRSLSRLLKSDWPRSIEELEERLEQSANTSKT
jgi:formamidopyrimidine-DNA glycosylase